MITYILSVGLFVRCLFVLESVGTKVDICFGELILCIRRKKIAKQEVRFNNELS